MVVLWNFQTPPVDNINSVANVGYVTMVWRKSNLQIRVSCTWSVLVIFTAPPFLRDKNPFGNFDCRLAAPRKKYPEKLQVQNWRINSFLILSAKRENYHLTISTRPGSMRGLHPYVPIEGETKSNRNHRQMLCNDNQTKTRRSLG